MKRFLTILCALFLWPMLVTAQDDRGFLQGLIEDNLSGAGREVRIVGFAGALSSRATLEELTIADDDGVWLTMRGAVLDWNRSALLRGRLEVTTLSADELIIPRKPVFAPSDSVPTAAAPGFSLPDLPVSVEIGALKIGRADLGEPLFGEAASISLDGSVSLISGEGAAVLKIDRVDGQRGAVTLDGAYSNETQDVKLNLSVSEDADGIAVNLLNLPGLPSVDLNVDGTGTLADFRADIKLATDAEPRLEGAITLTSEPSVDGPPLRRFSADIGGDLAPLFAPQYRPFFGPEIQLVASGVRRPDGSMNLEQLTLDAQSLTLEGQVAIAATGVPQTIALTGQIADPNGAPVLLPVGASPINVTRVDLDVSFDAALDDTWRATVGLIGLDTAGLKAANLTLSGTGQILTNPDTGNHVTAALDFQGQGLDMGSAEKNEALGSEITGKAGIDWQQGTPVKISGLQVKGAGVDLSGSGTLDIEGADLAVTGTLAADIAALSPFSGIAGRDLSGSVSARVSGSGGLLGGKFDVDLSLRGQDLAVSIPQVDPLLAGQSTVELVANRDETGLTISRLVVQSPEVQASVSGKLQTEGSTLQAKAQLREVALIFPELSGPVTLDIDAQDVAGLWQVKADAMGPGAAINIDGTVADILTAPVFDGALSANIDELGAFSAIAGRDLGGAVSARMNGKAAVSGEVFDIDLTLTSRNLMVDIPQADALLAGQASVEVMASRDATAIRVSKLVIDSPQVTGTASGVWQPGQSQVTVDARLAEVGLVLPQLSGPLSLKGTAQDAGGDWTVKADAIGPGNDAVSVDGIVFAALTAPVFEGQANANIADLQPYATLAQRDLSGSLEARVSGKAALSGEIFDIALTATSDNLVTGITQADGLLKGRATVDLVASRDAEAIRLSRLDIISPQVTGTASGVWQPGASQVTVDARLAEIGLVLPQLSGAVSLSGTAQENDGDWTVKADATGPGTAAASVDGTVFSALTTPVFVGAASADVADLRPYAVLAKRDLSGGIIARLTGKAAVSGETFDVDLSAISRDLKTGIPQADALLAGQATVDVIAARDANGITIERLTVTSPELTASASGALLNSGGSLTLDAAIRETALVYPQMSGPLKVTAEATGQGTEWQVDAKASGPGNSDVSIIGTLSDPMTAPAFDGKVNASADSIRPFSTLARRSLSGAINLQAEGKFDSADTSYDFTASGTSNSLSIGQAEADRLLAGNTSFQAKVAGKGTEVVIERLVVDTPQLDATVNGDTNGGAINLGFDIRLANVGMFAPGIDGPLATTGTARQSGGRWSVDLNATGPAGSRASVSGGIAADFSTANLDVNGQAPLALANRFITPNSVTGTVNFDLRVDGKPSLGALSGTVSIAQARAVVPGPGIVLNDITANVALRGGRANVSASLAPQAGGRISIDGPVALDAPFSANLVIRLANVIFTDPNLYKTIVDGQLTATGPLTGGAKLEGVLNLGRTEVQIPSSGLGASGDIPEIIHLSEPAAVRATRARAGLLGMAKNSGGGGTGPRYPIDVRIVASNQIFIRGRGLDAEMGGTLRLTGTTADLVPSGQFQLVRGRLDLLGQRLVLDEGLLRLQGDFRPYIRLVASTEVGDVRVIIRVEGEASDPEITFASEPELPEDEVLAQLLFGRSVDQISPLQAAQLASAVATLAGHGGVGIIGKLRQNFGLDDLDVTTDAEGGAAVRAGKYIGENLYTDVTIGSGTSEINLNLDISRTVTAKGTVSSTGETSLGIFFQRDY